MASSIGDLVLLDEVSEDGIYNTLSSRLADGKIYTFIGEVVISVNPYKQLPIYGQEIIQTYTGSTYFQNEPHIYALAEQMYKNLRDGNQDQCVLISGESGAGKTEASKKIMEYITAVSRAGGAVGRVAGMLLGSNPILEAFGNAKTIRNDNSSRFGKYMEIVFDYRAVPFGGRITNYLLEKVRVVSRSKTERSFHIFYMMLAGLKDDELAGMGLGRAADQYAFLKLSECYKVDGFDDKKEFQRVSDAMKMLGFTPDTQNAVWRTLGGILLLGNLEFAPGGAADSSKITNMDVLEKIARMWKVEPANLEGALVTRTFATGVGNKSTLRKGGVNSPLTVEGALFARDALAKAMYSGLFDFVVAQLNKSMSPPEELKQRLQLGILDIYGFEIFDDNSFEQFCINWCNEKLQQYFIELTLKMEQEEYAREGIEWQTIEFFNNQVIVDLIEQPTPKAGGKGPKAGLLALLNEACTLKNTTDKQWLDKIVGAHKDHAHFVDPNQAKKGAHQEAFTIKHYAGDVSYKVAGFVDKNNDTVYSDQRKMIETSKDAIVRVMMQNQATDDVKRANSAGTNFKKSLQELIDALSKCRPSYVRCIKPNEKKASLTAEEERFRHQIRYLGLLENIRVRRAGFCNRQTYEEFLQRYKMTVPRGQPGSCWPIWKGSAQDGCMAIIKHFQWTEEMYKMGKTKVFIRKPKELFALESARAEMLPHVAAMIQSKWRQYVQTRKFKFTMAVVKAQAQKRARDVRIEHERHLAIMKIQSAIRMQHEKSTFDVRKGAKVIKRNFKKLLLRRWLEKMIELYSDCKRKNQWGRGLAAQWPTMPAIVQRAETEHHFVKRMEETWRYSKLLRSIKGREKVYRDKVTAMDIFSGKKPWEPNAVWGEHSYLSSELNPTREVFLAAFTKLKLGDATIYFSDLVDKMNPDGKMVERAILLTDKAFYRMTPAKYGPDKHNLLNDITGITLTSKNDSLVVLHHGSTRDSVVNLTFYIGSGAKKELRRTRSFSNIGGKRKSLLLEGNRNSNNDNDNNADPMVGEAADGDDESERHSEFVVQLVNAIKDAGLPVPPINFKDEIEVNVSKKANNKQIHMVSAIPNAEDPNSTFKKGKGSHQITYFQK